MVGKTVSQYKILEKIGAGGMGVVYKAEDTKLKRTVALKFLPAQISLNEEEKKRFIHEARAAAALNHNNIVTIHEINDFEGETYIVMEYLEGETVKDKIEGKPLSVDEAVDIIDDSGIDSSYAATYWPWVQMNDTENNVLIWLPPTLEVMKDIALTDNIAFPWFASAGVNRGKTNAEKARTKLTLDQRDVLYDGRINPMATFTEEGVVLLLL